MEDGVTLEAAARLPTLAPLVSERAEDVAGEVTSAVEEIEGDEALEELRREEEEEADDVGSALDDCELLRGAPVTAVGAGSLPG